MSDFILEELGKKKYVGAVLVDLKKAFDTVDHKILLKKLFCHGFRDCSFDWFESYLSDRVQCTVLEGTQSSFTDENPYGVPQGSLCLRTFVVSCIHKRHREKHSDKYFLPFIRL